MKNFISKEPPIVDQLSLADEILAQQTITADGYFEKNVIELGSSGNDGEEIKYNLGAWFRHNTLARSVPGHTLPSGILRYSLKRPEQWPVHGEYFYKGFMDNDAAYGLDDAEKIVLNVCRKWFGEAKYRPGHNLKPNLASYSSEQSAFYSFVGRSTTYSAHLGVAPFRRETPKVERSGWPSVSSLCFWQPGSNDGKKFRSWRAGGIKNELEREQLKETLQKLGMRAVLLPRQ